MCEPSACVKASATGAKPDGGGGQGKSQLLSQTQQELNELREELKKMKFVLHNILRDRETLKTLQHYVRSMKSNFYG